MKNFMVCSKICSLLLLYGGKSLKLSGHGDVFLCNENASFVQPVLVITCLKDHFCATFALVYCSHLSNHPKLAIIED